MEDFEVVPPRGIVHSYLEEIRLSRALARAVSDAETQFALPIPILEAMQNLQKLYNQQQERGEM